MAVKQKEIEELLNASFPNSQYKIKDLVGDEDHYSLEITDDSFSGKTIIEQHKMVKEALKTLLEKRLHALTIKTIAK